MADLRSIPLFPSRYKCMLRYQDQVSATTTTGAVGSWVFSANGLFDPNITGTGHQPAGFDQMMVSYEHYTVTRSRILVTFSNATAVAMPQIALSHRAASTPLTIWSQLLEDGLVRTSYLMPVGVKGCITTMNLSANVAQFGGVDDLLDNPYYRGDITANPLEQSYFHVQVCDNVLGVTATVYFNVVIEYEAWFKEPRTLSQSMKSLMHDRLLVEHKSSLKCD